MAVNKTDLSFKKLINKEFTHVSRSFFQEVTAATLDLNSTEVYTNIIASTTASAITDGYARQLTQFALTADPTYPTYAWYVCSGSGFTPGTTPYDATKVQRNFISDKYGSEFEIKLYDNGGSQIFKTDAINWYFDYKTGILHVADPGAYSTPYKATIIQYIGTTLSGSLASLSGSIANVSTNRISSGSTSLTTYANGTIIASGSLIVSGAVTASFFSGNGSALTNIVSSSYSSTASYVINAISASHVLTSSYASTASYVLNSISSSYASTASYVRNAISASHVLTSSYSLTTKAVGPSNAVQLNNSGILSGSNSFTHDNINFITVISGSLNLGNNNYIQGFNNYVESVYNSASGVGNHVEGTSNVASGSFNHIGGSVNNVIGVGNNVGGTNNKVLGGYNNVNGGNNIITGSRSNVIGDSNLILDTFDPEAGSSHYYMNVEGQYNTGSAFYSHNEGKYTKTYGDYSHAEGLGTIASGAYQHVQGQYNIPDTTSLFIIGNGIDNSTRSNLMSGTGSILSITGSLQISGSITGSLQGTASYALSALTASYMIGSILNAVSSSYASTASYVINAISASYVLTSSYASTASYVINAISSSYSSTASYVINAISASSIGGAITNNTNDYILTATGNSQINGESNLTFDGSTLYVNGRISAMDDISSNGSVTSNDKIIVNNGQIETLSISASLFSSASYLDLGINALTTNIGRFGLGVTTLGGQVKLGSDKILSSNGSTILTSNGSDVEFSGNINVNGDLTVLGNTITLNTANILVEDKFILLASGSTSTSDGGIIIQNSSSGTGYALYFDSTGDGTAARWSLSENVSGSATTVTPSYFLGAITGSTSTPSSTPTYGYGTMHVVTSNGDIYIYS